MGMRGFNMTNLFLTLMFLFISPMAYADIANGLQGWYKFDEASSGSCTTTVLDSSGHANTGTCTGSPTWLAGHIGKGAMNFANTTGNNNIYVSLPFGTAFAPAAMTVTAWVYAASWAGQVNNPRFVASDHTDANTKGFQLMANNGAASGFFDVGTTGGLATSTWNTTTWPINTWIFYVGEYSGTAANSYAFWGGALKDTGSTGSVTGTVVAGGFNIDIGRNPAYASPDQINARMDDVRIYNRALSMSEIWQLYTESGKSNGFFVENSR
jgi:hypothetical protein